MSEQGVPMDKGMHRAKKKSRSIGNDIRHRLTEMGFVFVRENNQFLKDCYGTTLFAERAGIFTENREDFESIYGTPFKISFLVHRHGWTTPVGIEGRVQDGSGSACDKLETLYSTIFEKSPYPFFVILDGAGFPQGVRTRAETIQLRSSGKITIMASTRELLDWEAAGLQYPNWSMPADLMDWRG